MDAWAGHPQATIGSNIQLWIFSTINSREFRKTGKVIDEAYNGAKLRSTDQAVLSDNGPDKSNGYSVPLEIKPSGQFEPLYRTKLDVQDGELPTLPLSVYGAVAMAHSEVNEEYSSPYATAGRDILSQIKTGDVIRSAKLIEGHDRLVLPDEKPTLYNLLA
ncbi:hypothetical protein GBA52_013902 [Prunus armeniaca]|nr:hypothetical protein GBA52_013902 [Prunus armeniaca]